MLTYIFTSDSIEKMNNKIRRKKMNFRFRNWKVLRSTVQNDRNCKWVVYNNGNLVRTFPTKQKAVNFVNISIMVGGSK